MYPAYELAEATTNPYSNFASTRDTISIMRNLVTESLPTPQIEVTAQGIAASLNGHRVGIEDVCRKVFWWLKSHMRLVEDEFTLVDRLGVDRDELIYGSGQELLLSPAYLVQQSDADRQGDCDDFSTLAATLLIKLGVPGANVFFCTIAADANSPNDFSHVYLKVRTENGMFPLDCSHGAYPGWETPDKYSETLWNA